MLIYFLYSSVEQHEQQKRRWWPRRSPHGLQRRPTTSKKGNNNAAAAATNANMRFFFLFFENPTCVSDPNYKQGQRQKRAWPFKTWSWIYNFCEPGSNGSLRGAGALRRWRWSEDGWMQFFDKLNLWSKNWQKQKGERVHYRNWLIIRIGILIE